MNLKKLLSSAALMAAAVLAGCDDSSPNNSPEDMLYIAESGSGIVYRMPKNGGRIDTLFRASDGLGSPNDLIVDPVTKKLVISDWDGFYMVGNRDGSGSLTNPFTGSGLVDEPQALEVLSDGRFIALDAGTGIFIGKPDGSGADTLFSNRTGIMSWGIAVDVDSRQVFWSNYDDIYRANLDGTGTPVRIATNPTVDGVNLMTFNKKTGKLYFADYQMNGLFVINADGTGFARLATIAEASGMALDEDDQVIYVGCDDNNRKIYKYSLKDNRLDSLNVSFSSVSGLHIY